MQISISKIISIKYTHNINRWGQKRSISIANTLVWCLFGSNPSQYIASQRPCIQFALLWFVVVWCWFILPIYFRVTQKYCHWYDDVIVPMAVQLGILVLPFHITAPFWGVSTTPQNGAVMWNCAWAPWRPHYNFARCQGRNPEGYE